MPKRRKSPAFRIAERPNPFELATAKAFGLDVSHADGCQWVEAYAWFGTVYVVSKTPMSHGPEGCR
jgi:hypothetical protein